MMNLGDVCRLDWNVERLEVRGQVSYKLQVNNNEVWKQIRGSENGNIVTYSNYSYYSQLLQLQQSFIVPRTVLRALMHHFIISTRQPYQVYNINSISHSRT